MPELEPLLGFGVSPRATLGLVAASRAMAVLRGRSYVVPQDTFDVARDVLRHRLMLSYEALAKGLSADDILNRVLAVVPAASVSPVSADPVAATPSPLFEQATPVSTAPAPLAQEPVAEILNAEEATPPVDNGATVAATIPPPPPPEFGTTEQTNP
jgi:MoxR-like ATPase